MHAESILDALEAAIYSKDLEGRYTYANAAVRAIFGASLEEIVGKDDTHFFDVERSNALRDNDREVMTSGNSVSREERDFVKETGEERVFWTVKSPLRDASGEVIGMCGVSIAIDGK
jgi:PAS domain S-box-containing protein